MNSYIQFTKVDNNLNEKIENRCIESLRDYLFFVNSLRFNGEYWLMYIDQKLIGIFGFYRRWSVVNFVWALFSEYRGIGKVGPVFEEIMRYFGCRNFCISTINSQELIAPRKLYKNTIYYVLRKRLNYIL